MKKVLFIIAILTLAIPIYSKAYQCSNSDMDYYQKLSDNVSPTIEEQENGTFSVIFSAIMNVHITVMHNILYVKNDWIIECCLSTKYQTNGSTPINRYGKVIFAFSFKLIFSFLFIISFIIVYTAIIAIEIKITKYDKNAKFLFTTFA